MSDPLSNATRRAETVADAIDVYGTRQPRETAKDRLWTAVWALVGVEVLTIAAILGSVIYDEDHDDERKRDQERRTTEVLVVACLVIEGREVQPPACLRPDVQKALDELAP